MRKRFGLLGLAILLLAMCLPASAEFDPSDINQPEDLITMTVTSTAPWTVPLLPVFESAAKTYKVPLPLLLTLAYFGSQFENRGGAPTIEGGYGIMALRDNTLGGTSLLDGAALTNSDVLTLRSEPIPNIRAAAAVLDSYARAKGIDRSQGLQAWTDVVVQFAGLDAESSRFFASEVFDRLRTGLDCTNAAGERFAFDAQDIGSVDLQSLMPQSLQQVNSTLVGAGYSGAIWYPAASCNYTATSSSKDTFVVHTIEGSAAGCLSWFRNCSAQVSAHYVCSYGGTVWQCVDEWYKAWHVSCYNSRAIGCEHEGYASSSSHPEAQYQGSALLARDICNRWGIPKSHRSVGPGILGHIDITNCCCGTHTDPGSGWDWSHYIALVNGTPPAPAYAASYHAQSYPSTMTAGETAVVWVEYTNNGTGHWTHGNTRLGTSSPQDRSSPFYNSANWIGANRPTDVDQSDVAQGSIGRFSFILKAPSSPGTYVEHYKLVQEGVTWFGDEITWTITVVAAKGNITGTVRNSANGQAISGATVAIAGGASTTTNSSGVYTFSSLDPDTYTLNVSKSGFGPASGTATVIAGQTTTKDFNLVSTDTTPPTDPSGLTATGISPSQINLSWTASTDSGGAGLAGYIVYRNSAEVGRTTAVTYQDNGLTQNTTYTYYVKAYDNANNISGASNTASAATQPSTVPIFEDGFASINGSLWTAIQQSPMPGPYPPVWDGGVNHGTFTGSGSIKTLTSSDANQGCLLGHAFSPGFGAAKFESWFYDSSASNNSRQGLQVRCLDGSGGVKAIYYLGTYSASPGSFGTYSAGYYKVCGSGCTGWYWPGAQCRARAVGWHKFTIEFLPYTGSGDVKYYIDGTLACTTDRTLDTQTYGLNMVAYGYHYRVNVEGWFDDCAMYSTAPLPPTMGSPSALSTTSIRWALTDNSNNEMGFRILDAAQTIKASATVLNGAGGTVNVDEGGLAPNTPYTRYAKAYNGTLNSVTSAAGTRWTLSTPPSGSNVTCDRTANTWYKTPAFSFSAVGGFGQGTVSGYRYAWDQNPTYSFTGAETVWNTGDLLISAGSEGDWYLHVQGLNGDGVANGTLDLGPYRYDGTEPVNASAAVEAGGAQDGVWQATVPDPSFTWSGASDSTSGVADYYVYFGSDESGTSTDAVTSPACDPAAVGTGVYYLRVKARDYAGNESGEWATLFTFKYDSSAPDAPSVADDGPYSGSRTKLHATWCGADADSGIAEYQYAIGTSAGGNDVLDWTTAGSVEEGVITVAEPGLTAGSTYYVSVNAKNGAGSSGPAGSSDGIQVVADTGTIADAKKLGDDPVALMNKIVIAASMGSYYVEEADRFAGLLVLGPLPAGAGPGSLVTVGGEMGVNANNERAVTNPATIMEAEPNPEVVPPALYVPIRELSGGGFYSSLGVTDHLALQSVGLLVAVIGHASSVEEHEFMVNDGSTFDPIKVVTYDVDLSDLGEGDLVLVKGVASIEQDGEVRRPILRVYDQSGLTDYD